MEALVTEVTALIGTASTAVGAIMVLGFGIFGLMWGGRKLKGALTKSA